jgi:uncharacterized membrane protein
MSEIKYRNLKKDEQKQVIKAFIDLLKNLKINNKAFVINATTKAISTNPQISIDEIQKTYSLRDKTKLDFIRQLYIRSGNKIVKKLFPDEDILNLPVISFEENGNLITLNY